MATAISQVKDFYARFVQRIRALPGVQSAAVANYLPLAAAETATLFNVEGQQPPQSQDGFVMQIFDIGPGYFLTMGSVVIHGREFSEHDREGTLPVAVINEEMANRFWPGRNPVGQRVIESKLGQGTSYEIVGMVQTGKYRTLGEDPRPVVFLCYLQHWRARSILVAHFQGNSQSGLAAIRRVAQELEPRLALTQLMTLDQHLTLALFPVRTTGLLLGTLGLVVLLLAVSGCSVPLPTRCLSGLVRAAFAWHWVRSAMTC